MQIKLVLHNLFHVYTGQNQDKVNQKNQEDVQIIRKADLENHNKDGGMWVVIHGKVYDVHEFKTQVNRACIL